MGTAALVAGGIAAVGSVAGSVISSSAASSAADKQLQAANNASALAQQQSEQTRADLAPYRTAGGNALNILSGIFGSQTAPTAPSTTTTTTPGALGAGNASGFSIVPSQVFGGETASGGGYDLVDRSGNIVSHAATSGELSAALASMAGPSSTTTVNNPGSPGGYSSGGSNVLTANGLRGLTFQPTQAELEATPGYQFTRAQGLQSVANSNAAAGRGISGAALKGAANYATGLADNTLKTQQGIFQANLSNILSPIEYLATSGQDSAAKTGTLGLAATQNANALAVGGANAAAAGTVGSANAISGGLNSLGSAGMNYLLYSKLLGGGGGGGGGGGFYDTTSTFGG